MPSARYPWYEITRSDDIEQGDIFDDCPVFLPPSDLADEVSDAAVFRWETRDLIVMTQSCDIVSGREQVLLGILTAEHREVAHPGLPELDDVL